MANTIFSKIWDEVENAISPPTRSRNFLTIEFSDLKRKVLEQDPKFARKIIENLYAGDTYLVKKAFTKDYCDKLKVAVHNMWTTNPSSFHKMIDGVPNFHREIGRDVSDKYYAKPIKHSYYFFPWNEDSLNIFAEVRKVWGIYKLIGGLTFNEYEQNLPRDGIIDRIQVVNYPLGGGKIDVHFDPYHGMKPVLSTYLSKRGEDYHKGGFYLIGKDEQMIDVEDHIDVGDMSFTFPTVAHGVAPVDEDLPLDFKNPKGRWWLGMFSVDSDMVKDRKTGGDISLRSRNYPETNLLVGGVATVEPKDI